MFFSTNRQRLSNVKYKQTAREIYLNGLNQYHETNRQQYLKKEIETEKERRKKAIETARQQKLTNVNNPLKGLNKR